MAGRSRLPLAAIAPVRPFLRRSDLWRFVLLALLALFSGLVEAALLFLVIKAALSLSGAGDGIDARVGPITLDLSIEALLGVAALLLVGLLLASSAAAVVNSRLTAAVTRRTSIQGFRAFIRSNWQTQSTEREGRLQQFLANYVERLGGAVVTIGNALRAAVSLLALVLSALVIHPLASGALFAAVGVLSLLTIPLSRATRRAATDLAALRLDYVMAISESISLARESHVFDVADALATRHATLARRVESAAFLPRVLARMTGTVSQTLALGLVIGGMYLVHRLEIGNASALSAVIVLMIRAVSQLQTLNSQVQQLHDAGPSLESLHTQIGLYESAATSTGDGHLAGVSQLAMRGVRYAYPDGAEILRGIDFQVGRGAVLGIVGPSGGGKSTLIQLVLRLREPQAGTYLVDGAPAASYSAASWARHVALVPQDNRLFRGTVADNIRIFRAGLDDGAVENAARQAHLHEDILQLPHGYQTLVGAGAVDLSGGQRQRLGLARALAGRPSVLVLDEPTSALDPHSEALVHETLESLHGDLTMLVVAHREATLELCDLLLVLRDGAVEAFGPADEIRATSAFFAART